MGRWLAGWMDEEVTQQEGEERSCAITQATRLSLLLPLDDTAIDERFQSLVLVQLCCHWIMPLVLCKRVTWQHGASGMLASEPVGLQ
jgi:hypothetical protein